MKKIILTVADPCHENWNAMSPSEKGRFCSACQKTVIDFTNSTDRQIAEFFKKPLGATCGRFYQDQLNRELRIPAKRLPWVQHFFQILLPAFLLTIKAQAQKEVTMGKSAYSTSINDKDTQSKRQEQIAPNRIRGKVVDENGYPVAQASVMIKGTTQGVACDSTGRFDLPYLQALPLVINVSSVGYETREYLIKDTTVKDLLLPTSRQQLTGEVIVVGYAVNRKKKNIPLISWPKPDTLQQQLYIYPNPVRSNGNITIESKKLEKGTYGLQIRAVDGNDVCTKALAIENKGDLLRTDLPSLTPGTYVITLTHKKTNKVYTKKIQIL